MCLSFKAYEKPVSVRPHFESRPTPFWSFQVKSRSTSLFFCLSRIFVSFFVPDPFLHFFFLGRFFVLLFLSPRRLAFSSNANLPTLKLTDLENPPTLRIGKVCIFEQPLDSMTQRLLLCKECIKLAPEKLVLPYMVTIDLLKHFLFHLAEWGDRDKLECLKAAGFEPWTSQSRVD